MNAKRSVGMQGSAAQPASRPSRRRPPARADIAAQGAATCSACPYFLGAVRTDRHRTETLRTADPGLVLAGARKMVPRRCHGIVPAGRCRRATAGSTGQARREVDVGVSDDTDPSPEVGLVLVTSSEPDDAPGRGDRATTNDAREADLATDDRDPAALRARRR